MTLHRKSFTPVSTRYFFDFVGADGYYDSDVDFVSKIEKAGLLYMFDFHSEQPVYPKKPERYLPEQESLRGRAPKRLKA